MQRLLIIIIAFFLFSTSTFAVTQHADSNKNTASNKVYLATTEWPPYVSKELKNNGYVYQLVKQAFSNKSYQIEIKFMPWDEVKNFAQHNHDGFFPAYEKESTGDPNIGCSMPFNGGPVGLYRRKTLPIHFTVENPSANQALAFEKLQQYDFGVVNGYENTDAFDQANYLTKISVKNDFENLKQLQEKKVDLIIIDVFVAEYYIDKYPTLFTDVEFMGPALENKNLYLCFNKQDIDYLQLLSDFNAALISMKASGQLDEIYLGRP